VRTQVRNHYNRKNTHDRKREREGNLSEQKLSIEFHSLASRSSKETMWRSKPFAWVTSLDTGDLAQEMTPPGFVRTTHDDMPDSVSAGKIQKRLDRLVRPKAHDLGAEIPRPLLVFEQVPLRFGGDAMIGFFLGIDVNHKPVRVEPSGETRSLPQ
jgi:hypothetical protein